MAFLEYFTLLDVLPAFDIDMAALEASYFREQRRNHPDRFIGKPEADKMAALQRSADINKAYETLRDPLKRAQYLLLLQGIFVGTEKDNVKPGKELLAEIMELREAVDEARDLSALYQLNDELTETHEKLLNFIGIAYTKSQWDKMAQQVLKLGYIEKTMDDVRKQKARMQKSL